MARYGARNKVQIVPGADGAGFDHIEPAKLTVGDHVADATHATIVAGAEILGKTIDVASEIGNAAVRGFRLAVAFGDMVLHPGDGKPTSWH